MSPVPVGDFQVQVGCGGAAAAAGPADGLTRLDSITFAYHDHGKVCIPRARAIGVLDDHGVAEAALRTAERDAPSGAGGFS
jgi:hypothetical protein